MPTQFLDVPIAERQSGKSQGDIVKWHMLNTYNFDVVTLAPAATSVMPIGTMLTAAGAVTTDLTAVAAIVLDMVQIGMTNAKAIVRGPAIINIEGLIVDATGSKNFAKDKDDFKSSPLGQTGCVPLTEGTTYGVQEKGEY